METIQSIQQTDPQSPLINQELVQAGHTFERQFPHNDRRDSYARDLQAMWQARRDTLADIATSDPDETGASLSPVIRNQAKTIAEQGYDFKELVFIHAHRSMGSPSEQTVRAWAQSLRNWTQFNSHHMTKLTLVEQRSLLDILRRLYTSITSQPDKINSLAVSTDNLFF